MQEDRRKHRQNSDVELYRSVTAMEPLLPNTHRGELADTTVEILAKGGKLVGSVPSEVNQHAIARLVREMNSYYSNLIEGHKTLPRDIERALRKEYSKNSSERDNQHLSRAHFEVEELMLQRLAQGATPGVHTSRFIQWLHKEFYGRLPEHLHYSETHKGRRYKIAPGKFREFEVDVHAHQPPAADAVPRFMERFEEVYASDRIYATNRLVALAAAHHRLAWIHPFGDGNGRVARLQSHACLFRCDVNGLGLWTLSRGLARQKPLYYERLAAADKTRRHDTDGRGNLSDEALADFCLFFMRVIVDQIDFMAGLLRLDQLSERIDRSLQYERLHLAGKVRERLARLLRAALVEGEIPRGRVHEITGVAASTSRGVIQEALNEGLMHSSSAKGPLALNFSSQTLESWFPGLYLPLE